MELLKIIEWNMASVSMDRETKVDEIVNEIIKQDADVVVLTEVTFAYRMISNKLINREDSKYFMVGSSNAGNANNIVIAISNNRIDRVIFDDFYAYQTGKNIKTELVCERNNHPDRVLVHLKLKNGKRIKLIGLRMQVSGLSHDDKCLQFEALKWEIENAIPDIVIGDFNWHSTIYKTNKEDEFNDIFLARCQKAKRGRRSSWKNKYNIWPDGIEDSVSFISKDGTKKGNPDRVMWRENIRVNRHEYYNKITVEDSFPEGWLSDHDILIFEVEI